MHAACVIAPNYLAHARVLADSFRVHHPEGRLTLLIVGASPDVGLGIPGAEVLEPAAIGISKRELDRRGAMFTEQGVISSLRPLLLKFLLDGESEAVLLLDADMLVLGSIEDVWRLAAQSGVLLSPHTLDPLPGRPGAWREEELLGSGAFSGGFLGVGPKDRPFLDWLAERAARDCLNAPERGLLFTQTWLTLVPALFPCHVLRDQGINAQIHGLGGSDPEWRDGVPYLGATPLRLYHFAGFDPSEPERLCRYYEDEDQVSLQDHPGLAALCRDYAQRLREAGWPIQYRWRWAATPGGFSVDAPMRRAFRDGIIAAESGEGPEPPNPFDPIDSDTALTWLLSAPDGTSVSRYLLALRAERMDLRAAFVDVPGASEEAYLLWASENVDVG